VVRGKMIGKITSLDRLPADGKESVVCPTVTTEAGYGKAKLPGLLHDQAHLGIITWNTDGVGFGCPDCRQLSPKIRIAAGVALLLYNRAAKPGKFLLKEAGKVDAVILLNVRQHCDLPQMQFLASKTRQDLALKFIQEAHPKDIVSEFGDSWIGRARS